MPRMSFTAFAITTCYDVHLDVYRASSVHASSTFVLRWNPPRCLFLYVSFRFVPIQAPGGSAGRRWTVGRRGVRGATTSRRCVRLCFVVSSGMIGWRWERTPTPSDREKTLPKGRGGGYVKLTSTLPKDVDCGSKREGMRKGGHWWFCRMRGWKVGSLI